MPDDTFTSGGREGRGRGGKSSKGGMGTAQLAISN
jgi:hypothetical protein